MRVKSYYATSVEAAMSSAAQEMGPDAVLITSRRTAPEARHLGDYEVVFGIANESGQPEATAARASSNTAAPFDLDLIRREMQGIRRALNSACRHAARSHWSPELTHADAILSDADVPSELKDDLLAVLDARLREELLYDQARPALAERRKSRLKTIDPMGPGNTGRIASMLREEFGALLEVAPIGSGDNGRSIIALAGPSGCGKTTTIVKLAIRHGITARRSSLIISTDTYRIGASEQLRLCAAAIGVNFQVADTPVALRQVIEENSNKQLILIDTPGLSPADMDANTDVSRFLALHPGIDVHLLLPATCRATTLAKISQRFEVYGPTRAIVTKLDEADSYGAALGQAILSNLPISAVTTGQQIPDDLVPADKDRLLRFLGGFEAEPIVSVA